MAEAIPLPPAPTLRIRRLSAPTVPPSHRDVVRAHDYVREVRLARYDGFASGKDENFGMEDYAEAIRYEARLLANTEDGQPAWFAAALAPLQAQVALLLNSQEEMKGSQEAMKGSLEELKGGQGEIKDQLKVLTKRQAALARAFAKHSNYDRSHSLDGALQIVPFPDGQYPSDYELPALDTLAAVENLSTQHRNDYLRYYYPDQAPRGTTAERKKLLLKALGCNPM
ncbi:hypothetical protein M422DRAFT_778175 [Sphaerobolus stellatus SS14]|nr:hypothetical protein M422DRAFT_778175 [Sphaerobolus stellatus SS14]